MIISIGDRVRVTVNTPLINLVEVGAVITHIDQHTLYQDFLCPIQVDLDQPYNEDGQTVLRVSLKEIKHEEENNQ